MLRVINVERLTLANFQTHNVVVVTALSTLCIAVFFLLLLQNLLFRVFVNFYEHAFVCVCVCMCAWGLNRGALS